MAAVAAAAGRADPTSIVPPTVLLVCAADGAPHLRGALSRTRVLDATDATLEDLATDVVDVVVVDQRAIGPSALPLFARIAKRLPTVIVAAPGGGDGIDLLADELGAADVERAPLEAPGFERRIRTLAELRRFRRAATVTEASNYILDALQTAVVITDEDLNIVSMNQAARTLVRVHSDIEPWLGQPALHTLALPESAREWFGAAREGKAKAEYPHVLTGGAARDVALSIRCIVGAPQTGMRYAIVLRDLALSRQAERTERLGAVRTMASGFVHETRNPLTTLRFLSESLAAELALGDPRHELADHVVRQIVRLESLVHSLAPLSRTRDPATAPMSPALIVRAAIDLSAAQRSPNEAGVRVDVAEDLPVPDCDPTDLVEALGRLLDNALDATGDATRVTVRVIEQRDITSGPVPVAWLRFTVEDDGPGITPDLRGNIFRPFFTTKPSRPGLGLAIADQLVHENGGRIDVAAAHPQGVIFSVVLRVRPPRPKGG